MPTKFPYNTGFLLKALGCFWLFVVLGSTKASAQFIINEGFKNSTAPNVVISGPGGNDGMAYLTSGVNDPVGAGWLRLSTATANQRGFAYIDQTFPSTMGVLIEFEYKMWRNNADETYDGADGIGVFLFDGTVPFEIGGFGGSLGYAPKTEGNSDGLAGGYVGIGIDAYGNFANPVDGPKRGGPLGNGVTAERPNSIVMRGPTTNNNTDNVVSGVQPTNRYLAGRTIRTSDGTTFTYENIVTNTGNRNENAIDWNTTTSTRPSNTNYYRRMQIEIVRVDEAGIYYNITVRWKKNVSDTSFTEIVSYTTTDVPPSLLKIGFAAATGGGINIHEIRNIMVTTPNNVRVVKLADKDFLRVNTAAGGANSNQISYTVEVTNDTEGEVSNMAFLDRITDINGNLIAEGTSGFNVESISTTGFVSAALPVANTLTTNEITGTLTLAAGATGRITVTGRLYVVPEGNRLVNTATATPLFDEDLNNNTSEVSTPVIAEGVDLIVTKTVDQECTITSGNGNTYTMYVSNIGAANASYRRLQNTSSSKLAIYNVVPPGYTYSDSATPGGFSGGFNSGGSGSAKWSKITMSNQPSSGYTTYLYVARGDSDATYNLNSGMTYPHPIVYTLLPSGGVTNFTDTSTAIYFSDNDTSNTSIGALDTNMEPAENLTNNEAEIEMFGTPPAPTVPGGTVYYCVGSSASPLSATVTNPAYSLRWYSSSSGFSSDYPITPYTGASGTYTYYVSQVNGDCEGPQATITVTVMAPTAGSLTGELNYGGQQVEVTCYDSPATVSGGTAGTVGPGGTGTISYRWEQSTDGTNWETVSGTGASLTTGNITVMTYFRRFTVVTNGSLACESSSPTNTVLVYVGYPGVIGTSQTFCTSSLDPSAFTSIEDGLVGTIGTYTFTYRWQYSDNGTTWIDITGTSGDDEGYNAGTISNTRYYRRTVQYTVGGSPCISPSNVISVTKVTSATAGTLQAQTICSGSSPTIVSATAPSAGTYQWQVSNNGSSGWSTISGATGETYNPGPLTASRWYRRRTVNACSTSGYTAAVKVTVLSPTTGNIGNGQTVCYGGDPSATTSTAGSAGEGSLSYRWESAPGTSGAATWTTVAGATGATYDPPALTESMRYRRYTVSTNASVNCEAGPTNEVVMTVKVATDPKTIGPAQAICNGAAPAQLTGPAAIGDGAITYQWQYSNDGSTGWTNISGATSISYTPGNLSRYYRRVATAGGLCSEATPGVLVTYQTTPNAGTITAGSTQTICYNTIPAQLTSNASGSGIAGATVTYRWEASSNGTTGWTTASGTSNQVSYQPPALTATTYYRRVTITTVLGNSCEAATSNVVVTVNGTLSAGTVSGNQVLCSGSADPAAFTSTGAGTTGAGITYQWQISSDGTNFTDIAGATSATYDAPSIVSTTYYRRAVRYSSAPNCQVQTSNITVTVEAALSAGTVSGNQTFCTGGGNPVAFTSTGAGTTGAGITYQWQISPDGTNFTDISGATSATYDAPSITSTTYYRRAVRYTSGSNCQVQTSNIVVTVNAALSAGTVSGNQTMCFGGGDPAAFTSTGAGTTGAGITYQWQISSDGTNFTDISGATSATYDAPAITAVTYYRRAVRYTSSPNCQVQTSNIVVTIGSALSAGTVSGNQTFCTGGGDPASFASTGAGTTGAGITYQWQISSDGTNFTDIGGATSATYDAPSVSSTTYYRRAVRYATTPNCQVQTSNIVVTINAALSAGSVSGNQTLCSGGGDPAAFTSTGAGTTGAGITYQWQISSDGTNFTDISGATSATYDASSVSSTTYYRRAVRYTSAPNCQVQTSNIVITIGSGLNPGSISGGGAFCSGGGDPGYIGNTDSGSGYSGGVEFFWQSSTNGGANWSNISSNTNGYDPSAITQTTMYRRGIRFTSGSGCEVYSNAVTFTVLAPVNPGTISGSQTVCYNTVPAQLTGTAVTGLGTVTYQWQQSSSYGSGYYNASGVSTGQNYQPEAPWNTVYYRRIAIDTYNGVSCQAISDPVTITMQGQMQGGNTSGSQTICSGVVPTQLTGSGESGSGTLTYRWEQSANGSSGWTTAAGTSSTAAYQPPALSATTYYRRVTISTVGSSSCEAVSTTVVTITVQGVADAGSITSGDQSICYNITPAQITATAATSNGGTITYRWEQSPNGSTGWTAAGGSANQQNYTAPAVLTATTYYRRIAISSLSGNNCELLSGGMVTVLVQSQVVAGNIGSGQSLCVNSVPAQLTGDASTGSGIITYQWEQSPDGSSWTNATGTSDGQNYQPPSLSETTIYRRRTIATANGISCEAVSNTAYISIYTNLNAGSISGGDTYCDGGGDPAEIANSDSGSGANAGHEFIWQYSTDEGANWDDIAGASLATYDPPALTATTQYRRVVKSTNAPYCEVYSNVVTFMVRGALTAGAVTGNKTYCSVGGDPPAFANATPGTTGTGITYQWQQSADGINFTDISGANSSTYNAPVVTVTTYYRRAVRYTTEPYCQVESNTVVVTIREELFAGSISGDQAFCAEGGNPEAFTSDDPGTTGAGIIYQWQRSTNGGASYSGISGSNSATYDPPAVTATTYYRRVVRYSGSPNCQVFSSPVIVTVNTELLAGTISGDQTFCSGGGNPVAFTSDTPGTTGAGVAYQWQESSDGINFSDIAGAVSDTYDASSITETMYYRRAVQFTSGSDCTAYSLPVTVTVMDATTAGTIGAAQSICINSTPVPLTSVDDGIGSGAITYRWESSANGTTGWAAIPGETGAAYSPGALAQTIYYRRITIATLNGTVCESAAGSAVKIEVKACKLVTNPTIHSRVKNGS